MSKNISLISFSKRHVIFIAVSISGACALISEAMWPRNPSFMMGLSMYAFSAMLAVCVIQTPRRRKLITLWMLCFACLLVSCTEKDEIKKYPVFGVDALDNVLLFESSGDVLPAWAEEGIRNAVLLHVSDADSLGVIPQPNIEKLKDAVYGEERLYTDTDYLYAASRLGIIRKIYWILPYRFFDDIISAENKIKQFLKDGGAFSAGDIDRMRMEFGCLTGRLSETDVAVCSPRTMHTLNEPVLLSIDTAFFPLYADGLQVSKLHAEKKLFDELAFRKIRIIRADIICNTENGRSRPRHRYLAFEFAEGIRNPQIFQAATPPDLWTHRDTAENMLSGGEDTMVLTYLAEPLKKHPQDIPLKTLSAIAHARAGHDDESFSELNEVCGRDVYSCYGFIEAGKVFAEKKSYDKAEKYFLKALEALPGRPYVKERYLSFRTESGRRDASE